MRWRVSLQSATASQDTYGQPNPTWTTVGTYWAQIETLSGRELVNALQKKAETTHRVTLRWLGESTTPNPKWRIVYKARTYNVLWINNVGERNRTLELYCEEVVSPP